MFNVLTIKLLRQDFKKLKLIKLIHYVYFKTRNKKIKERDETEMNELVTQHQNYEMKSVAQRKHDRLLRDSLVSFIQWYACLLSVIIGR